MASVCDKSKRIVIGSTATCILPAFPCVHSDFTNPGYCCNWWKLLPGRNKEAEQKWHCLTSHHELRLSDGHRSLSAGYFDGTLKWKRWYISCWMLWSTQWSMTFVGREGRNPVTQVFDIHIVFVGLLWNTVCGLFITSCSNKTATAPPLDDWYTDKYNSDWVIEFSGYS